MRILLVMIVGIALNTTAFANKEETKRSPVTQGVLGCVGAIVAVAIPVIGIRVYGIIETEMRENQYQALIENIRTSGDAIKQTNPERSRLLELIAKRNHKRSIFSRLDSPEHFEAEAELQKSNWKNLPLVEIIRDIDPNIQDADAFLLKLPQEIFDQADDQSKAEYLIEIFNLAKPEFQKAIDSNARYREFSLSGTPFRYLEWLDDRIIPLTISLANTRSLKPETQASYNEIKSFVEKHIQAEKTRYTKPKSPTLIQLEKWEQRLNTRPI